MLFEVISKDNKKTIETLKIFITEAEREYGESIPKAKGAIKKIQGIIPTRLDVDSILPDTLIIIAYEENEKIYLKIGLHTLAIVRLMGKTRSMAKNLRLFLKEKGIESEVKYLGD
jgi:hypothetical protein